MASKFRSGSYSFLTCKFFLCLQMFFAFHWILSAYKFFALPSSCPNSFKTFQFYSFFYQAWPFLLLLHNSSSSTIFFLILFTKLWINVDQINTYFFCTNTTTHHRPYTIKIRINVKSINLHIYNNMKFILFFNLTT